MTYQPEFNAWYRAWQLLDELQVNLNSDDPEEAHVALDVLREEGVQWSVLVANYKWQSLCLINLRRQHWHEWRAGRGWNLPVPPPWGGPREPTPPAPRRRTP
jgi:hypothetical protein